MIATKNQKCRPFKALVKQRSVTRPTYEILACAITNVVKAAYYTRAFSSSEIRFYTVFFVAHSLKLLINIM